MDSYVSQNNNQPQEPPKGFAIASLVLGIIGFIAWCLPLVGYPVTIVGLVLGVKARSRGARGMATAGMVLCIITLIFTVINSVLGAVLNVMELM